jgi:cofilin
MIAKIDSSIQIDVLGARDATHDDLIQALPKNEPRYVIYDFAYTTRDERDVEQLIFIFWCPDNCQIKKKMM